MTTVVPFTSETMESREAEADRFGVTADELKARRSEITMLEARCGDDAPPPEATGWQRWLFPLAAGLFALGFGLALHESSLPERGLAALALGTWAAITARTSVRGMRLAVARRIQGSRRAMTEAVLCAVQAIGIVALVRTLAPEIMASVPFFTGAAVAAISGWQSGRFDPRTERMREDLHEARADLFRAEAEFEREIEDARFAFDAEIEQARETAGLTAPDSIAAE